MSRIHLTIDRILLPDIDPADRTAMLRALQSELHSVLAEPKNRAAWAKSHRTPVLRLAPVPLEQGTAGGGKFGHILARSIGKGLIP